MSEHDSKVPSSSRFNLSLSPAELSEEEKKKEQAGVQRTPLDRVTCRAGDQSCARAHTAALNRSMSSEPARAGQAILRLQRGFGNQYVRRVISLAGDSSISEAGPEVEAAIQSKRGGGQELDSGVRRQMESSFKADFGNVRVHHDAHSDNLNRDLKARAFTTGQDIFFSQGAYRPGTSGGRELLAHELTHVVQQNGDGIRAKLTVSNPGDALEREADDVARSVIQAEQHPQESQLQRQPESLPPEEEEKKKQAIPA